MSQYPILVTLFSIALAVGLPEGMELEQGQNLARPRSPFAPGKAYIIKEAGWACDQKDAEIKSICGYALYREHDSIRFGPDTRSLRNGPTHWTFEQVSDSTYVIYERVVTEEKAADGEYVKNVTKKYWEAENDWTTDWIEISDEDKGDRWEIKIDDKYPGKYKIYAKKNCDLNSWPCDHIITFQKDIGKYVWPWGNNAVMYLKLDKRTDPLNQSHFIFVEAIPEPEF